MLLAIAACAAFGCQDIIGVGVPVAATGDAGASTPDAAQVSPDASLVPDAMVAPTCSDGDQNGDESDVDCGGACPRCASGRRCALSGDCESALVCDQLCRLPMNCAELQRAGVTTDGIYIIDPDGDEDRFGPLSVQCDMTTDAGGWTLVGDYHSELELFAYSPVVHQVQNDNGGANATDPPVLDGTIQGHLAYDSIATTEVRLHCLREGATNWFGVTSGLFTDWSPGDKGTYGGDPWGVVGHESYGRSNHYICGRVVNTGAFFGVALCRGPGADGSFANHLVSLSFTSSGGLSIGCNGTGLNDGKSAMWRARVWVR